MSRLDQVYTNSVNGETLTFNAMEFHNSSLNMGAIGNYSGPYTLSILFRRDQFDTWTRQDLTEIMFSTTSTNQNLSFGFNKSWPTNYWFHADANSYIYGLHVPSGRTMNDFMSYYNGGASPSASYPGTNPNGWVHVMFVFDGSTLKIIANGVTVTTENTSTVRSTGSGNWYIGGYGNGSSSNQLSYWHSQGQRSPTELGPIFFADKALTYDEVWAELKAQEMYNA